MRLAFFEYVKAAFKYRPGRFLLPPNWLGLAAFGVLGALLREPGIWMIGAGVELGYLFFMATNPRFQRVVHSHRLADQHRQWQMKTENLVAYLEADDRVRYANLSQRCQSIVEQQSQHGLAASAIDAQGSGLGRLLWIYLRLLLTRHHIQKTIGESESEKSLESRLKELREQLKSESVNEDLRTSLKGQMDILQQRLTKQREAREKLMFLEAELTRIQDQVELIREQAVLVTDPDVVSQRINEITATLGGTTEWIAEQQKTYGAMEEDLAEPAPVVARPMVRERA